MGWIWILIFHLLALALLFRPWPLRNSHKKLPPGPKGFPILGCLHLLGKLPHRDFHRLSQRYGPIMHMKLGLVHTIVVSSPEAAELFLKTHDLVFASRPLSEVVNHIFYGQKDILFAPYGSYWRNMRKMCTLEFLNSHKISSFKSMRREEVGLLVEDLREAANSGAAVDLTSKIFSLILDMSYLMIFGRKYDGEEVNGRSFKWVLREASRIGVTPNLGDFIPYISPFDLQGLNRRAKFVHKVLDVFLERIIDEHLHGSQNDTKDFVDVMLDILDSRGTEYQINRSDNKAIIFDMVLGSVDTSATTIGWVLFELIKHPQVMKKLQEELEKVVGLNRKVEESDLGHVKYLDMVVKETLRLHPPGPLLAPHESLEDCTINNFYIPKRSRIIVNAWAIARDSSVWSTNAEKFLPERFIDSKVDIKGRDFQLIPFGAGRRGCPGIQMGLNIVHIVIAQLVHCFDWKLPNGMSPTELDMTEEFGLTCPRVQDLIVTPTYRLHD